MSLTKNVDSNDTNGFDKTVDFTVLHCANVDGNNNKYYCIEIQYDEKNNLYRIYQENGRLGCVKPQMRTRGPFSYLALAEKEYKSLINSKKKGKNIEKNGKNIHEYYVVIDTPSPDVGSSNIRNNSSSTNINNINVVDYHIDNSNFDTEIKKYLNIFVMENVHNLSATTSIKFTLNGASTPLGPVTKAHVGQARIILDKIHTNIKSNTHYSELRKLNTEYFSLIPHKFGSKIKDIDLITEDKDLIHQYNLLSQLETAISLAPTSDQDSCQFDFGFSMEVETDKHIIKEVFDRVEKTKKHANLKHWQPYKLFKISNTKNVEEYEKYTSKLHGDKFDLFHGTRNSNIMSILMNGLYVPPVNAPNVTGRMFGNGIYAAKDSTKALNYSAGYWGGVPNKYSNIFMFIVNFAMGNCYTTKKGLSSGVPKGYHSIHAQAGQSLLNDEFIVVDKRQALLRYMIEFKSK